jgi:hypothetical protein
VVVLAPLGGGAAAAAEPLRAFRAARVVTMDGPPRAPGVLLVRGARVEAVLSATDPLPEGAETVDLGGAVVLPGLVNPLSGIASASDYRDGRRGAVSAGGGSASDTRNLRAAEGLDPAAPALRRLGRTGYAAIALAPSNPGFLGGLAGVARARAAPRREKAIIKDVAYLSMSYALGQPVRELAERELGKAAGVARKAREEREKKEKESGGKAEKAEKAESAGKAAGADEKGSPPAGDPLVQVFAGELPAVLRLDSAASLDHFLRIARRLPEPFRFYLATPPLEPEIVEKIAKLGLVQGVILEPRLEARAESSVLANAARLFHDRGLEVALVPPSDDLEGHQGVYFALSQLVKAGFPEEAALRAVTAAPAKILGIGDRFGSLAAGREASFVVFDGDPLSGRARVLRVYLEGEEVYRDDPSGSRAVGEAVR